MSGKVLGVEALLRWQRPQERLIGPERFLAIAEDSALIDPLDMWVLRGACAQIKRWQDAGLPPFKVAINLAVRQIIKPGLTALVATVLEEVGVLPARLELDITEPAPLKDFTASAATLGELKELGTEVALDDFGNGHSAISFLRCLPVDVIKLDRSLIQETGHPGTERIVALTLTELAHSLAIEVVAVGVETPARLSFLRRAGCDAVQGHLVSQPLDVEGVTAWISDSPPVLPNGAAPTPGGSTAERRKSDSSS